MNSPCSVRHAAVTDASRLRTIRLEALRDTPEAYGLTYEESLGWSAHEWRKIAKYRNYFLGECDGVVAGMASGGHNDAYPGTGWLYSMYVSPKYRGSGLANQLVDAAATWARGEGAQHLYLHVTGSVQRARAFYAKVGFVENGEIIVMERDPSITLRTMVKPLD